MSNDIAMEVYLDFAKQNQKIVEDNPICQKCKVEKSVMINRFGTILACCSKCLRQEQDDFDRHCREVEEIIREENEY